jgi:hypothetical protein
VAAELQLSPVLAHVDAGVRGVAWPPARAALIQLRTRWQSMAESTSNGAAKARQTAIADELGKLVVAVDAESEALSAGRDWSLLRPRVEQLRASLLGQLGQLGARRSNGDRGGSPGGSQSGPTL